MARYPRDYTEAERQSFLPYREARAKYKPVRCKPKAKANCWVEIGPPAISSHGKCIACNDVPLSVPRPEHHR